MKCRECGQEIRCKKCGSTMSFGSGYSSMLYCDGCGWHESQCKCPRLTLPVRYIEKADAVVR